MNCICPECPSSHSYRFRFTTKSIEVISNQLATSSDYRKFICPYLSPLFYHPEYLPKLERCNAEIVGVLNGNVTKMEYFLEAFENKDLFSHIMIPKGEKLSSNNLCFKNALFEGLYLKIQNSKELFSHLKGSFKSLITQFHNETSVSTTHHIRGLVLISLFGIWMDDDETNQGNFDTFISCISNLNKNSRFFEFLGSMRTLFEGTLRLFEKVLTIRLPKVSIDDEKIRAISNSIQIMSDINERKKIGIPQSEFENSFFSSTVCGLDDEKIESFRKSMYVSYPCLFNLCAKALTLKKGIPSSYITLKVSRESILNDTLKFLLQTPDEQLINKKICVEFLNEIAVDTGGGITREFLNLVSREIFSPKWGNFICCPNGKTWINHSFADRPNVFKAAGKIVGFAFQYQIPIPVRFPMLMYKKLLDQKIYLNDLEEIEPEICRSLESLREMVKNGENISTLDMTFTASSNTYDKIEEVPLVPGGEDIMVTNTNLEYYIGAYVNRIANTLVDRFFTPLKDGFEITSGNYPKEFLSPKNLASIVSGFDNINWDNFKKSINYTGFSNWESSITIKQFWSIFDDMSQEDKRKMLYFITGVSYEPAAGFDSLKIEITRGSETGYLPVAHTCINQLVIPDYCSYNILKHNLSICLENAEGFGIV